MNTSKVIFTAVPSPIAAPAGKVRVTVLVSPRLYSTATGPKLGQFDFGEVPWPLRLALASGSLKVRWNGGAAVAAELAPPRRPVESLDSTLWSAIFPVDRRVIPYQIDDYRFRAPVSYDLAGAHDLITQIYTGLATSGWGYLPITYQVVDNQLKNVSPATALVSFFGAISEWVRGTADKPKKPSTAESTFYDALRFYHRPRPAADEPEPAYDGDFDFHQIVGLLGDHPTLMRKLGLVFDVLVPAPAAATGTVEVSLAWRASGATGSDFFPRTRYEKNGTRFLPAAQNAAGVDHGYLRLEKTDRYRVLQLDVDSAVLKLADFGTAMRARLLDRFSPAPTHTTVPSLRSAGLTIAQVKRLDWLAEILTKQQSAHDATSLELWAEDLVRGYRVDIQQDGVWRSLHRRKGDIFVDGADSVHLGDLDEEEGYVKAASSTSGDGDTSELYLHEAIAGWSGYSLSVRPPGKSIVHAGNKVESVEDVENTPGDLVGVQAEYAMVPGSLPRLRFGQSYRVRVRVADVAAGGLPFADTDASAASPSVTYRRFEPVTSPILAHRTPITEAESLEHLVIRSAPGSAAAYAEEHAASGYLPYNHRHVLPPKASLEQVERHGKLDPYIATRSGANEVFLLARREAGTITDRKMYAIDAKDVVDVPGLELRNKPSAATPIGAWPAGRGESLKEGQYVLHTGEFATQTYLPDPMSKGVVFFDDVSSAYSGSGQAVNRIDWQLGSGSHAWARTQPIRLELQESTDGKVHRVWSSNDPRVLVYKVPPGMRVEVGMAASLHEDKLEHMGIWGLLDATQRTSALDLIRSGLYWMIAPPRVLNLVHAVQRPVAPAAFSTGTIAEREVGSTSVKLVGNLNVHGFSTSNVDVRATWKEVVDLPHEAKWRVEERQADVQRLPVAYSTTSLPLQQSQQLVKARKPWEAGIYELLIEQKVQEITPLVHELGDGKYRRVTYDPVSTSRYQEYFPPALIADRTNIELAGTPLALHVPGSMKPEVPRVAQIVPAFRFTTLNGERKRHGGAFRIYLERPWFTSGVGERLAILLHPTGANPDDDNRRFYSQWGRDPVWNKASPSPLTTSTFRFEQTQVFPPGGEGGAEPIMKVLQDVPLSPGDSLKLDILAYLPRYSESRRQWYVDVDLETQTAYHPFVRLALARYQERALDGQQLSEIVHADFFQLSPDRAATVTEANNKLTVKLVGAAANNASTGLQVRAAVQWRQSGKGNLAWEDFGSAYAMILPAAGETNGIRTWQGTLNRPLPQNGREYRVHLSETEIYLGDSPANGTGTQSRVTYFDLIPYWPPAS